MTQYGLSPYANVNPSGWSYQSPLGPIGSGFQAAAPTSRLTPSFGAGLQNLGESAGLQTPGISFGQPDYGNVLTSAMQQHLSPEQFAGSLGRQPQFNIPISSTDATFITELARCGRGLQDVAEQLEGKDQESQRRGLYAATAHLFYAFGLLSSKGIFIPGELPVTRTRTETIGVANACREFGKQLDRFVDKYTSGRGVIEEISNLVERGKVCYTEITKGVEGESSSAEQQARKKVA
jgi:hypothetical protein